MSRNAIAIAFSDLHLTLNPPACRKCTQDEWMQIQARYLKQVKILARKLGQVPILFAGDLFDRWNPPPELINFALRELPDDMICVPGQHDLPNHRIEDVERSGYGVLAQVGKIRDMSDHQSYKCLVWNDGVFVVRGFGWGQEIEEPVYDSRKMVKCMQVALVHRYCWSSGFGDYPGAPQEYRLGSLHKELKDYDFAVFGDNHKGFIAECGHTIVANCGTFIRRKSDEIALDPSITILYDNVTAERHKLDTSNDVFHEDAVRRTEVEHDVKVFIDCLEKLGEHGLDFKEAVKTHLRDQHTSSQVKQIILEALESEE